MADATPVVVIVGSTYNSAAGAPSAIVLQTVYFQYWFVQFILRLLSLCCIHLQGQHRRGTAAAEKQLKNVHQPMTCPLFPRVIHVI
jgi:hypothetical protein